MKRRGWFTILFLIVFVLLLSSCGVKDDTGIIKNLLKGDALNPSYADSTGMNSYLRGMRGYTGRPTFVPDGQNVHFEDVANYYTLKDGDDFVTCLPRQIARYETSDTVRSVTRGIIVGGALYNGEQSVVYSANKGKDIVPWKIAIKKENSDTLYVVNGILPYSGSFYFIQDGALYRCKGKELEYVGLRGEEELFQAKNAEQVFNQMRVRWFGIFSDTAVIIGEQDQIWTVDLSSGEAVCVFEGNKFFTGGCCVDGDYIYYVADCDDGGRGSLEKVKLDGSERETDLLTINSDVLMNYVFNISDGTLYYLQYSKLNSEYFLCAAPLSNLSAQVTLAHGVDHGIDEWVSELYPIGEWVYYATMSMGFWRAKTDGTLVEKIQGYNNENPGESLESLTIDVKEQVSDFVFEQHELLNDSNPNMIGGYCGSELEGKNASWKLEGGVLTISGDGDMADLDSYDDQPWANVRFDATSIVVEEGITSIGDMCFRNLSNVTSVSLPSTLKRIGRYAFFYTNLESIDLPVNLENIGEYAFSNLTSLTGELVLPDSITEIGESAFYGCSGLTGTLKLPSSLTTIGEAAFSSCGGFSGELTIPSGVEIITFSAFSHCYQLSGTVTLSEGVKVVEQSAFYDCPQIETINLPSTIERIESRAFDGCSNVTCILCYKSLDAISRRNLPYGIKLEYVD